MYKNEIKKELYTIYKSIKNMDDDFINIKIAIHNLDKLGFNMIDDYKLMDNIGIEFYKFKMRYKDLEENILKDV